MWTRQPPPWCPLDLAHPINRGLVGCWLLGEGAPRALDSSPFRNHGTLTNFPAAPYARGHHGGMALNFDGVNDHIVLPYIPSLVPPNPVTYCAWGNIRTAEIFETFVKHGNNAGDQSYNLQVSSPATAYGFAVWGSSYNAAGGTVVLNTWVFLAGTFDRTTMRLYVNGRLVASDSTGTVTAPTQQDAGIIGNSVPGSNQIDGLIDNVRCYNRALSPAEIQRLYAEPWVGFAEHEYERTTFFDIAAAFARRRLLPMLGVG